MIYLQQPNGKQFAAIKHPEGLTLMPVSWRAIHTTGSGWNVKKKINLKERG